MARYVDAVELPIPIEEAFDYLADFSRTAEWDPGVDEASRLTQSPVGIGSRFRVTVSILGRRIPLEYRITEFDRPTRLVLTGGDSSVHSEDEITFVSRPGRTRVIYEARLDLLGIRRIADPILDLLLQRIGRVAMRGLRERLQDEGSRETRTKGSSKPATQPVAASRKRSKSVRKLRSSPEKQGVA